MRDLGRLLGHFQPGDRARVEGAGQSSDEAVTALVDGLLDLREKARAEKDFARSDALRNLLNDSGVEVHDGRERARSEAASSCLDPLMERLIALRTSSRANKDFATADALRRRRRAATAATEARRHALATPLTDLVELGELRAHAAADLG